MTGSDLEDTLRRRFRRLGTMVDTASDLDTRIEVRRTAAARRHRSRRTALAVLGVVIIGTGVVAGFSVSGHPQRVVTAGPTGTTTPTSPAAASTAPASDAGSHGRFVRSVRLDGGSLTVTPAAAGTKPSIELAQARVLFGSDILTHSYSPTLLGFGEVSIDPTLTSGVQDIPAWVGIVAMANAWNCPLTTIPPTPPSPALTDTPGYVAVVIEGSGRTVLDYSSGSQHCEQPAAGPSVKDAAQLVSIPWQELSFVGRTITYRYQHPACDPYPGLYSTIFGGDTKTGQASLTLNIEAPYSLTYDDLLRCAGPWITGSGDFGLPPNTPGAPQPPTPMAVSHGRTGPLGGPA